MHGWGQSADPRLQIQIAARGGEGSCRAGRRVCRSQIAAADLAGICRVKSAGSHLSCSKSNDSLSADCRFFFSSAITDGICKVPYMPIWPRIAIVLIPASCIISIDHEIANTITHRSRTPPKREFALVGSTASRSRPHLHRNNLHTRSTLSRSCDL